MVRIAAAAAKVLVALAATAQAESVTGVCSNHVRGCRAQPVGGDVLLQVKGMQKTKMKTSVAEVGEEVEAKKTVSKKKRKISKAKLFSLANMREVLKDVKAAAAEVEAEDEVPPVLLDVASQLESEELSEEEVQRAGEKIWWFFTNTDSGNPWWWPFAKSCDVSDEEVKEHVLKLYNNVTEVSRILTTGLTFVTASVSKFTMVPPEVEPGLKMFGDGIAEIIEGLMPEAYLECAEWESFDEGWTEFSESVGETMTIKNDIMLFHDSGDEEALFRALTTMLQELESIMSHHLPKEVALTVEKYVDTIINTLESILSAWHAINRHEPLEALDAIYFGVRNITDSIMTDVGQQANEIYKIVTQALDTVMSNLSQTIMNYKNLLEEANTCFKHQTQRERQPTSTEDGTCPDNYERIIPNCWKNCPDSMMMTSHDTCSTRCGGKFPVDFMGMCGRDQAVILMAYAQMANAVLVGGLSTAKLIEEMHKLGRFDAESFDKMIPVIVDMAQPFVIPICQDAMNRPEPVAPALDAESMEREDAEDAENVEDVENVQDA
eukprot:TRINITY_DN5202_c0_g1_i2.p1 TRINITY_DN5202_c0_g1~~TRINITY_DN5202_c0_g1_i2.p1  ORF type:complete len:549 (+),score=194.03 TRINITY_DN5202_c0_g1_i2:61-1707(+)